tara:strand:+ start:9232 stop:9369 length:138 start_codon:yes stop_codon:yes gene_type:complete
MEIWVEAVGEMKNAKIRAVSKQVNRLVIFMRAGGGSGWHKGFGEG